MSGGTNSKRDDANLLGLPIQDADRHRKPA
jgi:hypothetical protein